MSERKRLTTPFLISLALSIATGAAPAEPYFVRGDCNGDGQLSGVTDAVFMLESNFVARQRPPCLAACDANGDGRFTGSVTDAVYLLSYQFVGGPSPPPPFPDCGPDPSPEAGSDLGCETPPLSCGASLFVSAPAVFPNPNRRAPLAAIIRFETRVPAHVTLFFDDGLDTWTVTPSDEFVTEHSVPVLGLRAGRGHEISVRVRDESGLEESAEAIALTAPGLPAFFPRFEVTVSEPERMEPGVTLFPLGGLGALGNALVLLDARGEVVWYYLADQLIGDARRLRNGNLLYQTGQRRVTELDMFGNTVTEWYASGQSAVDAPSGAVLVETDSFHHEVYELPESFEADFLTLSSELRIYPDYPASESDPDRTSSRANVVGDVIVEFRRDGTIVKEWKLLDILDPYRIGYGSLSNPFWNEHYGVGATDWSHANGVILDETGNSLIVSLRHQDAVVKIGRETGELVWILGPHEGWRDPWRSALLAPASSVFEWSYHQHAPQLLPNGHLLLFDNGNGRAVPPAPPLPDEVSYSRAVEYAVDTAAGTVSQVWAYGGSSAPWFSGFFGDADYLPTKGNVLVADGGNSGGKGFARIVEVTRTDPPEAVFEVLLRDESFPRVQWLIYRSERLSGVYPR